MRESDEISEIMRDNERKKRSLNIEQFWNAVYSMPPLVEEKFVGRQILLLFDLQSFLTLIKY